MMKTIRNLPFDLKQCFKPNDGEFLVFSQNFTIFETVKEPLVYKQILLFYLINVRCDLI